MRGLFAAEYAEHALGQRLHFLGAWHDRDRRQKGNAIADKIREHTRIGAAAGKNDAVELPADNGGQRADLLGDLVGHSLEHRACIGVAVGNALLGLGFGATNSVYPVTINKSYGPVYAGGIYGVALFGYMIFCTLITPRISAALVASTGGYTASFIYGIVLSCVAVASMYLIPKVDRKPLDAAEKQAESV